MFDVPLTAKIGMSLELNGVPIFGNLYNEEGRLSPNTSGRDCCFRG